MKKQWNDRYIWNHEWGILPGMCWTLEEDCTRCVDKFLVASVDEDADSCNDFSGWRVSNANGDGFNAMKSLGPDSAATMGAQRYTTRNRIKKQAQRSRRAGNRSRDENLHDGSTHRKRRAKRINKVQQNLGERGMTHPLPPDWDELYWLDEEKVDQLRRTGEWAEEEITRNVQKQQKLWNELTPFPMDATWRPHYFLDPVMVQRARLAGWSEERLQSGIEREKNGLLDMVNIWGEPV